MYFIMQNSRSLKEAFDLLSNFDKPGVGSWISMIRYNFLPSLKIFIEWVQSHLKVFATLRNQPIYSSYNDRSKSMSWKVLKTGSSHNKRS